MFPSFSSIPIVLQRRGYFRFSTENFLSLIESTKSLYSFSSDYKNWKRSFDVIAASVLLVILSPVIAISVLLVRFTSIGPVMIFQKRLTENGRVFTMFKLRTMRYDAESSSGAIWASANDPRITGLGKFLRALRLDELPQLFNVLKGDMSLIGPRPERPELSKYLTSELPSFNKRLKVKAGITGLAQTSNGYVSTIQSYRKKLALDIVYINKCSFLLDLKIALKTILVIITGSGR